MKINKKNQEAYGFREIKTVLIFHIFLFILYGASEHTSILTFNVKFSFQIDQLTL